MNEEGKRNETKIDRIREIRGIRRAGKKMEKGTNFVYRFVKVCVCVVYVCCLCVCNISQLLSVLRSACASNHIFWDRNSIKWMTCRHDFWSRNTASWNGVFPSNGKQPTKEFWFLLSFWDLLPILSVLCLSHHGGSVALVFLISFLLPLFNFVFHESPSAFLLCLSLSNPPLYASPCLPLPTLVSITLLLSSSPSFSPQPPIFLSMSFYSQQSTIILNSYQPYFD